ncbi:MAG TPA: hypothetical protein VFL86_29505 [Burkholderiaceae bacterium]|nr:hypothetical protein [Burkholderiaceae bacterium]
MTSDANCNRSEGSPSRIPEDRTRLKVGDLAWGADRAAVVAALRLDQLALIQRIPDPATADTLLADVASALGLLDKLKLQAGFASIQGHRELVSRYFMTVNRRADYQFIPPHSEGDARTGIQLGALYCVQNTTDGGENILFNTHPASPAWARLRAVVKKVDAGGRPLGPRETAMLRALHGIKLPEDLAAPGANVIDEAPTQVPGIRLYRVLEPVSPLHSVILGRDVPVYWDNVSSFDIDCGAEFMEFLQTTLSLREPAGGVRLAAIDVDHSCRVWRSGVHLADIFAARITHKLQPGELLLFNNLTWAHATNNWTPRSGQRTVLAAFA